MRYKKSIAITGGVTGMVRLHLSIADLAGLRVLPTLGPLMETIFSLGVMQGRGKSVLFSGWRQLATAHLSPADADGVRLLFPLDGRGPVNIVHGGEEARGTAATDVVDDVLSAQDAPPKRDSRPVTMISAADMAAPPTPVRYLTRDDQRLHERLLTAFTTAYRTAVRPYWQPMHAHLQAEHAVAMRAKSQGGINELLSGLHPAIRWDPPVLHIGTPGPAPHDPAGDLHLDGRGLIVIGSVFCFTPTAFWSPIDRGPVILAYPALSEAAAAAQIWFGSPPRTTRALAALLGATRATILCLIADKPRTTSELARLTNTTPANASQHATVLRDGALIATRRHHNTALHVLSPTGAALLGATPSDGATRPE